MNSTWIWTASWRSCQQSRMQSAANHLTRPASSQASGDRRVRDKISTSAEVPTFLQRSCVRERSINIRTKHPNSGSNISKRSKSGSWINNIRQRSHEAPTREPRLLATGRILKENHHGVVEQSNIDVFTLEPKMSRRKRPKKVNPESAWNFSMWLSKCEKHWVWLAQNEIKQKSHQNGDNSSLISLRFWSLFCPLRRLYSLLTLGNLWKLPPEQKSNPDLIMFKTYI